MSVPAAFCNLNLKFVAGKLTSQTTEPVAGTTHNPPTAVPLLEFV